MRCRTSVVLRVLCISIQQHMACQHTARLVMIISLPDLLCCAWLLCMAAVHGCSPSPPHDVVVKEDEEEEEEERGRGQPCASRKISTQMCAPTRTGCRVRDAAGCATHHHHTHTCSWRASLLSHHSMKKGCGDRHGESVWWWSWCGPLAGMHGVVAMVSCTAAQHGFHLCQAKRRERMREGEGVSV